MRINPLFVGLGGVALLALAGGGRAAPSAGGGGGGGALGDDDYGDDAVDLYEPVDYDYDALLPAVTNDRQDELRWYLEEAGLAPEWVLYFEAVAANESNFKSYVGLGDPALYPSWAKPSVNAPLWRQENEHEAAITAYKRNEDRFLNCGYPTEAYTFGSGGWFALLPGNGLKAFFGTSLQCLDPYFVFSKGASVVMAIEMARRLMGWKRWKEARTFANLRTGWKNPTSMGDEDAMYKIVHKPKGLAYRYTQLGANTDLIYSTPPPLPPKDPVGLFNHLAAL